MSLEIQCRLFGGVGNQLFQYSAGYRVASTLNARFVVDTRWLEKNLPHKDSDMRQLAMYNPDSEVTVKSHGEINPLRDKISTKLASSDRRLGKFLHIYTQNDLDIEEIINFKKSVELRGYFQNAWSLESALHAVPRFSLRLAVETKALIEAKKSFNSDFVSVHIRRGDYLNKSSIHKVLTKEYYSEGLNVLLGEMPVNTRLLVFSDDSSHIDDILPRDLDFILASDLKLNSLEELHLMSLASGFIIANSTYSFWPAILAPAASKVVAPSRWFKSHGNDLSSIYPKAWRTITT